MAKCWPDNTQVMKKIYASLLFVPLAFSAAQASASIDVAEIGTLWKANDDSTINLVQSNGHTKLTEAVTLGDLNKAKELLNQGAGPNVANAQGDLPITIAANAGRTDMVNTLIQKSANVDAVDAKGKSALYYAVANNNVPMAQALLVGKANPNANGVVDKAIENKNQQMLLALSTYNADFNPGLIKAAQMNDAQLFRTILNYGGKCTNAQPFQAAVDRNNTEIAMLALDNGVDANQALTYCIQKDARGFMVLCVSKGADVNAATAHAVSKQDVPLTTDLMANHNADPNNVLMRGLAVNSLPIAEAALQRGADPTPHVERIVKEKSAEKTELLLKYKGDSTLALKTAVLGNDLAIAQLAANYGGTAEDPALMNHAVTQNNADLVRFVIEHGGSSMDPALLETAVNNNNAVIAQMLLEDDATISNSNLIKTAVTKGNQEMVELLVDFGAEPDDAMETAIGKNDSKLVEYLIGEGADATKAEFIAAAAGNGNESMTKLLLDNGADPSDGMKSAAAGDKYQIVKLLIERGADVSDPEIMLGAVSRGYVKTFMELKNAGAPVSYISSGNDNLLHYSCRVGSYPITEELLKMGLDVNQKNSQGETPLIIAVDFSKNDIELCQLLLNNGADIKARDGRGKTVYQNARGRQLKKFLKSQGAPKK